MPNQDAARADEITVPLDLLLTTSATGVARRMLPDTSWSRFGLSLARQPGILGDRVGSLGRELAAIVTGESDRAPAKGDNRLHRVSDVLQHLVRMDDIEGVVGKVKRVHVGCFERNVRLVTCPRLRTSQIQRLTGDLDGGDSPRWRAHVPAQSRTGRFLPAPEDVLSDPDRGTEILRGFLPTSLSTPICTAVCWGRREARASSITSAAGPPRPCTAARIRVTPATLWSRPRTRKLPMTCSPRSAPERLSAWPSTEHSGAARAHRRRWPRWPGPFSRQR
jgi:hypothetical protein